MLTAIISDIHGNLPAFKAVLRDAHAHGADNYVFIGDCIFDLPWSNEVARTLMRLPNAHVVAGNKEEYLRLLSRENPDTWTHEQMGAVYQAYREMPRDVRDYLSALPGECRVELDGGRTLAALHRFAGVKDTPKHLAGSSAFHRRMLEKPFTHEQYLEYFSGMINEPPYPQTIGAKRADAVAFGHNHLQGFGLCGGALVINPGSCGQPLDFDRRAAYTLLDSSGGSLIAAERRVEYDVETAIDSARGSEMYRRGRIWLELVFMAMRTGRDYFGFMFEIASRLAAHSQPGGADGKLTGGLFSNDAWRRAYDIFCEKYRDFSH